MVQIISGEKGKGKTKQLLEKVNESVRKVNGNIVYLDKNTKHMYDLSNKVRLIDVPSYPVTNCDEFLGFVCGIASQDNDLQEMYLDSFLTIATITSDEQMVNAIHKLEEISDKYDVDFILSVSRNERDLPDGIKDKIVISL